MESTAIKSIYFPLTSIDLNIHVMLERTRVHKSSPMYIQLYGFSTWLAWEPTQEVANIDTQNMAFEFAHEAINNLDWT